MQARGRVASVSANAVEAWCELGRREGRSGGIDGQGLTMSVTEPEYPAPEAGRARPVGERSASLKLATPV